jgi:nucleoid-associated protein YgaU
MQPIERYGLIALIFLVITIAAACLWDPEEETPADGTAVAQAPAAEPGGAPAEPHARDFVGARSSPRQGQALSERQRERLLALQQEEAAAAPQGGEQSARDAIIARREAALAAQQEGLDAGAAAGGEVPRTHIGGRAEELLDAASGKAHEVMDFVRPEAEEAAAPQAPAATKEPVSPPSTKRTYVIKKGDTLSEIASKELGTWKRWKEIVDANPGLDADNMRVGARIALPGGAPAAGASAHAAQTASQAPAAKSKAKTKSEAKETGGTYVVQSNDSLWKIAEKALGDGERWREIASLNPKLDPDHLEVGDRLALPARGSRPASSGDDRVAQAEPASKRGKVR